MKNRKGKPRGVFIRMLKYFKPYILLLGAAVLSAFLVNAAELSKPRRNRYQDSRRIVFRSRVVWFGV